MLSGCGALEKTTMKHSPITQAHDDLIRSAAGLPEPEILDRVNRFFNSEIRYASDFETWGKPEYWATPSELMDRGQGDCEDFAVSKFFTLKWIGVPEDKLNLIYCRIAPGNRAHVVVGYLSVPDADPLILDSVPDHAHISPASMRADLSLILGFSGQGLWVFKHGVRHRVATSGKRLRPWRELSRRMAMAGEVGP